MGTRQKKIVLINGGFHGHVNPTLQLTRTLVARGYEVVYLCTAEFAPQITQTGARFVAYPSHLAELIAVLLDRFSAAQTDASIDTQDILADHLQQQVADWQLALPSILATLQEEKPDLIACEFVAVAGRLAAEIVGCPTVQLCSTYVSNAYFDLQAATREPGFTPRPADVAAAQARLNQWTDSLGCRPLAVDGWFHHAEATNLVFVPRVLQPAGATFDERFHFLGPSLRDSGDAPIDALLPPGHEPLVYISLGTIFNRSAEFYRLCIDAVADLPLRVVLAVGAGTDLGDLADLPPHVRVHQSVPQIALLRQCRAFVTHGGMNSTLEALSFGVPLIVLPQMGEQGITARRVAELGCGLHLVPQALSAIHLRMAIVRLIEERHFTRSAQALAAEFKLCGGAELGADLVAKALAT